MDVIGFIALVAAICVWVGMTLGGGGVHRGGGRRPPVEPRASLRRPQPKPYLDEEHERDPYR